MKIITSALAERDLFDIWFHGAGVWGADVADAYLDGLGAEMERLAEFPDLGRERPDLVDGLRSLVVKRHTVFYSHDAERVRVERVLNSNRDFETAFRNSQTS